MLGYANWTELWNKIIGIKHSILTLLVVMAASLTSFITHYVYSDANAVYFMFTLVMIDAATGIIKSLRNKTFSSARLPRILAVLFCYSSTIAISFEIAKINTNFNFISTALISGFCLTSFVSIFENLHILKIIPNSVYTVVMEKLNALQTLFLGKFNILKRKTQKPKKKK